MSAEVARKRGHEGFGANGKVYACEGLSQAQPGKRFSNQLGVR